MSGDNWTLADLRQCNVDRQAAWCPDQVPDLSFRGNELAGEVGEACNVIKKLERERQGWRGSRASREQLAEELADVVICADLAALTAGVNLMAAVKAKFDATSDKVGLPHRLASTAPSPAALPAGAQAERDRLAAIIEGMLAEPVFAKSAPARMALTIAARNVRRGRALTAGEKLENLTAAIDEDDPELANRLRRLSASAPAQEEL